MKTLAEQEDNRGYLRCTFWALYYILWCQHQNKLLTQEHLSSFNSFNFYSGNRGFKFKLTHCEWPYFNTEMALVLKKCDVRPAGPRHTLADTQVIIGKFLRTLLESYYMAFSGQLRFSLCSLRYAKCVITAFWWPQHVADLLHADEWTDTWADMMKLIVTFAIFWICLQTKIALSG